MARVEVVFTLQGVNFRLSGVTQRTDRRNLIGICFLDRTERRIATLAEILAEMDVPPLP